LLIGFTGKDSGEDLISVDDLLNPDKLEFHLRNSSNNFGEKIFIGATKNKKRI